MNTEPTEKFEPWINTWYTFNLNPSDKYQMTGSKNWEERVKKIKNRLYEELLCWDQFKIKYWLQMEFSIPDDSTRFPRLHFHGIIQFRHRKSVNCFYLQEWLKLQTWSHICIRPIEDWEKWGIYCRKDTRFGLPHVTNTKEVNPFLKEETSSEAEEE